MCIGNAASEYCAVACLNAIHIDLKDLTLADAIIDCHLRVARSVYYFSLDCHIV